jgi:hypothetical protein
VRRGGQKVKAARSRRRHAVSRSSALLAAGVALLCVAVFALAGRRLDTPGLYYDEVIQALPAAEFLREEGRPLQIPGASSRWLLGGWFPLMTQPYMGALKSQLLIPVFALAGATARSLRLTTLAWSCAGLLLVALWLRRLYGTPVALLTAALLAFDPSFLFVGRHDWGSVALALVCRAGGLWLLTAGWQERSVARLGGGGLLLGLGLYNKIDFAAFLAGAGLAFAAVAPRPFWRELAARPARGLAALAGFALASAPLLVTLPSVFGAARAMARSQEVRGDDLGEKLLAWSTLLDGSYFERLMRAGGSFERLGEVAASASAFPWILAAATLFLGVALARDARRGRADRGQAFALLAMLGVALALLAVPRAARIHHVMNVLPLPQLVVALAVLRAWRGGRRAGRALAVLAVAGALIGSLWVDIATLREIRASGGRGRWTSAVEEMARELPPATPVVSLDWGFYAPLRFLHPELELEEPVWRMAGAAARGGFLLAGGPRQLYLVWEPGYQVFDIGNALLEAVDALPPGSATVRRHTDRAGGPAFRSIRFARPHELVYRGGGFEVRLR